MCQFQKTCKSGNCCTREPVSFEFDEDGYRIPKYCEFYKENEVLFDISHSGLTKYMERCELSNYKEVGKAQKEAKTIVSDYVNQLRNSVAEDKEIPWLLLCGHYGLGKTHLATACFKEAIRAGLTSKPMYYVGDMQEIKNSYYGKGGYDNSLGVFKNIPFLFIDEFLKTFNNADAPIVIDLINYRYSRCLPTIITTELSPTEIFTKLASVMDRIIEKTQKKYIYYFGEECSSYRQFKVAE